MGNISSTLSESSLTTEEIIRASRHLSICRGYLVETVSGLSDSQWNFRPDSDTWSIVDNVEHLVLIEGRIQTMIGNMSSAPEAEPGHQQKEMDDIIVNEVPNRAFKVKAPIPLCPANRWTGPEALESFIAGREQTMRLLGAPMLRGRVLPHPIFGAWDGYQWLLAVASHSARHANQIRELKSDPGFPRT